MQLEKLNSVENVGTLAMYVCESVSRDTSYIN